MCKSCYVPDPTDTWFGKQGYPPDYSFPKYWGCSTEIKCLSVPEKQIQKPLIEMSYKELLGYPEHFEA